MPELPEVEHLRQSLAPRLIGRRVIAVDLRRADIVHPVLAKAGPGGGGGGGESDFGTTRDADPAAALHQGCVITGLRRHGKQMAIDALPPAEPHHGPDAPGARSIVVQLGMTGQMRFVPAGSPAEPSSGDPHVHVAWTIGDVTDDLRADPMPRPLQPRIVGRLFFRDVRRFGGIVTCPTAALVQTVQWGDLGPDALVIEPEVLFQRLRRTRRAIKAALLDQGLIAGLGNIYVDEALFAAGFHPLMRASGISRARSRVLHAAIQRILRSAIAAGGSTVRDYIDAEGAVGGFQQSHQVYGRAGEPCVQCGQPLRRIVIAQRSSTYCRRCQRRRGGLIHTLSTGC